MNEELLNGGLVTSGDPSYNQPGELSAAVNGFYRHDDDGLWRYPGIAGSRTISSATGHAINGIVDCRFDSVHKLIAQCNGKYWVANAEDNTSAFASALSVTEGTSLQALEHSGRWFVLNGTDTNRAFTSAGTFRNMGLLPVTAKSTNSGLVLAERPAVSATGYHAYWYTELVPIEGGETLESSYDADPLLVYVSALNHSAPQLIFPTAARNAGATAYRVYRSPASETTITQFPVGTHIATIYASGGVFSDPLNDAISTQTVGPIYARTTAIYAASAFLSVSGSGSACKITCKRATATADQTYQGMVLLSDFDWPISSPTDWPDNAHFEIGYTLEGTGSTAITIPAGAATSSIGRLRDGCVGLFLTDSAQNYGTVNATGGYASAYGLLLGDAVYASSTASIPVEYNRSGGGTPTTITAVHNKEEVDSVQATGVLGQYMTMVSLSTSLTPSADYNTSFFTTYPLFTDTAHYIEQYTGARYRAHAVDIEAVINAYMCPGHYDVNLVDHLARLDLGDIPGSHHWTSDTGTGHILDSNWALAIHWTPIYTPSAGQATAQAIKNIYIKVKYVGAPSGSGDAYPIIQYEVGDAVASVPSHMPPPKSSTGTVFQGMAIVNDTSRPRTLCASLGENPEYFNTYYELELPTRTNDEITRIETVNDVLIIGTKGSIWKANYFPTELDAQTNRGRVMRQLSDSHNIVNVNCATLFTGSSGIQELAFVSTNGVFATDGASIRDLLRDLRWSGPSGVVGPISSSTYSKCVGLVNDPSTQTLRLFINPGDGTSQVYVANYAGRHAKQGSGLKWAGPAYVSYYAGTGTRTPISCAYSYRTNNGLTVVLHGRSGTGAGCGTIAVEDGEEATTYHNLPDTEHYLLSFTTRDFYPAGKGRQTELKEAWLYGHYYTGSGIRSPGGTFGVVQHYVNADDDTSVSDTVASRTTRLASLPIGNVNCDGFNIEWEAALPNMHALYSLVLDVDDGGDTKRA